MKITRTDVFEFLATPAHAWIWVCAWLVGWEFTFGPEDYEDEDNSVDS